ncbi:cation channel sperm-associated protein 3 [Rhynchocyon petersi]
MYPLRASSVPHSIGHINVGGRRKDTEFQAFVQKILDSHLFKIMMISTISLNSFLVVLWTDYEIRFQWFRIFEIVEVVCVTIYSTEFYMKLYVNPIDYWKDGYNLLDVLIIIILSIPYILRQIKGKHYPYLNIADGLQSLRILKLITYSRGIRTLITALGQTVYTMASVLILFFLMMYIFAVLGFCLFGASEMGDLDNWGNLAVSFFTLFSLVTVDGWTALQQELDKRKFVLSRTFTIVFILLASFIFLSMFVGVMIIHTEDSIKKFKRDLKVERHNTLMEEKQVILKRQQEEVNQLMQTQQNVDYKSFSELVENFKKTLQHTDPMVLDDFGTSLPFIDVYLSTLDNQDTTIYKLQELYYEIVNVLSLMLEADLSKEQLSHTLEVPGST